MTEFVSDIGLCVAAMEVPWRDLTRQVNDWKYSRMHL